MFSRGENVVGLRRGVFGGFELVRSSSICCAVFSLCRVRQSMLDCFNLSMELCNHWMRFKVQSQDRSGAEFAFH